MPLFFWFDLFLEARAEILEKISLVFWEIWRNQKDILKLTDIYFNHSIIHTKTNFYTSLFSSFITQLPLKFPVKLKELELLHLPLLLFTKIHQIQQTISPIHQIQIRVVDVVVSSHVVKNVVGITLQTHFGGNWKIAHSTKGKTRR